MSRVKTKALLVGPRIGDEKAAYGGGAGGYTQNMHSYLTEFHHEEYEIVPCFHSVRHARRSLQSMFVVRFAKDVATFIIRAITTRAKIVHILGQYRGAAPRELAIAALAKSFGQKVVYEIKAGQFQSAYTSGSFLYRQMIRGILRCSDALGVEGRAYQDFLQNDFKRVATYLPNLCIAAEIPQSLPERFVGDVTNVLFVGYCYEGKGTFELVEACTIAAKNGRRLRLVLAGHQSTRFESWLRRLPIPENLTIDSLGRQPREQILELFRSSDIFCLPTRHAGEGHNNSINEAMMMGTAIIATRHGFLGDILDDHKAVLLDSGDADAIANAIHVVLDDCEQTRVRIRNAYNHCKQNFLSSVVYDKLAHMYQSVLRK